MPRPKAVSTLTHAYELFGVGTYDEALQIASATARARGPEAADAALLGIRILLRTGDAAAARAEAAALLRREPRNETAAVLLGIATFRAGDAPDGLARLEAVHRESKARTVRAEAAYHLAWAAYADRRLDDADRWLSASLDDAADLQAARGFALSAWLLEARGEFAGAVRLFRLALSTVRASAERDDFLVGSILHPLAVFAAELPDPQLAVFVRAQDAKMVWPASAAEHRFQVAVHLALCTLNDGDADGALDGLERAGALAHHATLRAEAFIETADIFRLLGEPVAARRSMLRAADLFRGAPSPARIEDQIAFLDVACVAARIDPPLASEWLTRYSGMRKDDDGRFSLTADRRVHALELQARGTVQAVLGDRAQGIALLRDARERWDALQYRRRAAYACADLVAFGETADGRRIGPLLDATPHHPLAVAFARTPRANASASSAPPAGENPWDLLPPSERRVLEALCDGISVKQMAASWNRSEFTIRNHLKRLFAKFEVTRSPALVARALALRPLVMADPPRSSRKRS